MASSSNMERDYDTDERPRKKKRMEEASTSGKNDVLQKCRLGSRREVLAIHKEFGLENRCEKTITALRKPAIMSIDFNWDEDLKLTNRYFKKIITDSMLLIDDKNVVNKLNMLNNQVMYPSDYVFVYLANRVYEERNNINESEQDLYGKEFDPTIGNWQLLTVAYSDVPDNNYTGAAYWNPDMQQVIISHRGVELKDLSSLYEDVNSVYCNEPSAEINSAVTFTDMMISVLQNIHRNSQGEGKKAPYIQLFFTGHSLGGWLAQITTFTAKYIVSSIERTFVKSRDVEKTGYHASAVVFDSPGSRRMLERIQDSLVNRCSASLIDTLDITSFLSAPNMVNICHPHVGKVYRLFQAFSSEEKKLMDENEWQYNFITHSCAKFKEVFCPETGRVREDGNGKLRIEKVKDWPLLLSKDEDKYDKIIKLTRKMIEHISAVRTPPPDQDSSDSSEIDGFKRIAKGMNNYHFTHEKFKYFHTVRYKTDSNCSNLNYKTEHSTNVFTQCERQFLGTYKMLRELKGKLPKQCQLSSPFSFLEQHPELKSRAAKYLEDYDIKDEVLNSKYLDEFIPFIKRMLYLFPEMKNEVEQALQNLPTDIFLAAQNLHHGL